MAKALPRTPSTARPRLTADDNARRIADGLRALSTRRDQIDTDELAYLEEARMLGWAWTDIAAAYPPSPRTGEPWSHQGVTKRWLVLDAKRRMTPDQETAS